MKEMSCRVRSSLEETYKIDGKMRKRTFKPKKFVVNLKDDHPFQADEEVIIINQKDYETILFLIKELEHDKKQLKKQIKDLGTLLQDK